MDCSICLEPIGENNNCVLPCNHTFHAICAMKFARHKDQCPLCRTDIGAKIHGNRRPGLVNMPFPFDMQTAEMLKSLHQLSKDGVVSDDRYQQVKNLITGGNRLADN